MNASCRFTDHTGQEWTLHLTYGAAMAVQRETKINLAVTSRSAEWVELLFGDPGQLVGVLWVLCEDQAKTLGISPEQFGHRFDGPTLEAAGVALANAIASFFPRSRIAEAIRTGLPKVLEEADRKAVEKINESLTTVSNSVASSPASAESIPLG